MDWDTYYSAGLNKEIQADFVKNVMGLLSSTLES